MTSWTVEFPADLFTVEVGRNGKRTKKTLCHKLMENALSKMASQQEREEELKASEKKRKMTVDVRR